MGLDSVELVMAFEEEFGIEIPDAAAEQLTTVGETYEYILMRLSVIPPTSCLTQRIFYKLRRALIANYGSSRSVITLDTKIREIAPAKELAEGWPFMELFADLEIPPLPRLARGSHWHSYSSEVITVRDLIELLVRLNYHALDTTPSREQVWERLKAVIIQQIPVGPEEIHPGASFTKDLGID